MCVYVYVYMYIYIYIYINIRLCGYSTKIQLYDRFSDGHPAKSGFGSFNVEVCPPLEYIVRSALRAARETENRIAEAASWLKRRKAESGKHSRTSATPKRRNGKRPKLPKHTGQFTTIVIIPIILIMIIIIIPIMIIIIIIMVIVV